MLNFTKVWTLLYHSSSLVKRQRRILLKCGEFTFSETGKNSELPYN